MKEKRSKNILKDAIWDYYLTNREITKEYKDKEPGKFNKREKIYVAAIIIGLLLLLLRYLLF